MSKKIIILTAGFGSTVGGYVPMLFGVDAFSGWSLLGAFAGGLLGIYTGFILSQ